MAASMANNMRQCLRIVPSFLTKHNPYNLNRFKIFPLVRRTLPTLQVSRHVVTYRQVKETKEGNVTTVEGVYVEDDSNVLPDNNPHGACPLCKLNRRISYKDVLIIRQFIREDGGLLPSRITGVCGKQQRHLERVVQQAQRAGLLPHHRPKLPDGSLPKPKRKFLRF